MNEDTFNNTPKNSVQNVGVLPLTVAHHEVFLYAPKFSETDISFFFDNSARHNINLSL